MKARTVAEACHRQGNHDAALIETWPVIAALEALRRVGDEAFATDDTLRHFYVLNGLALCDKDVQTADYYCKKAFEYDAFKDLEAVRLALRVNKRKGDIRTALKYARDGARISPQDREMRKEMDRQTAFLPSDPSVIIHSNSISNDSEAEATVLREQATSSANGVSKKRSKIPKKEHSGAVNRKKKKPKMKSYTRRGHQPVDQSTTGNEELLTPGSGKGSTSSQQENQAINQTKHIETTSERAFRIVSNNYEIRLACDDCAKETDSDDSTRGYQLIDVAGHKCREEKLFLRKKNESCSQKDWVHVTSRPPKCNLSDGLCDCTAQGCRRPHNACEQELWTWHSKNNVNSQDLIRDMRSSSPVRAMYIVSKLLGNQRYIFVCKACFEKDHDTPVIKKLHRPICKNGHDWAKNELCVFEEVNANDTTTYSRQEIDNIVTPQDLVIECSRSRQRQISELNTTTFSDTLTYRPTQLDTFSNASSGSEEDETDATCFGYVDEDDGLNIASPDGDIFYEIHEKHDIENLLNSYADRYKRCTLRLTGRHSAVCTPEVVANNFAKIEIKGRTNCGPTFDGDDVVVEISQTKELDEESTVLSGRVAGVLGGCVKRRSHVFVCTVDNYHSCLMLPRCGTAPKVHIIDSYVKENYSGPIKNQLVTIYKIRDGNLQQKCIERLNPKDRQSKLFVVRYIKWKTSCMYPLGCVVKAIKPGRDLLSGQRILNLQYQVQQQFPADVVSCAENSREPERLDGRRDLREEFTFTIDPPGCTDIDDALSVRRRDRNGHEIYEVDVHIADVTHYVQQADPVDIESRRRGTTFYPAVGCSAFHMLPQRLSEDLCSLLPEQRQTYTFRAVDTRQ
ncbi:hypothetical protein LSAT2_022540 [Lamellibrachia satsuma]|nr:hypothetical protein LSAT2_022540 [Lamellibrachia satsuma]